LAFDFPAAPAIDETYTSGDVTYHWDGVAWILSANAASDAFVEIAGDTMTGPLVLIDPNPVAPLEAAHKRYVDETVATNSLYQSVWHVATNIPDLNVPPNAPLHGYSWTAVTVDPNVPEIAPAGIPGIGGLSIGTNDGIVWNANAFEYEHIPTPLNASAMIIADAPPAGAFHGQQWWDSDAGKMYVWYNDGTSQQWVQVSGGGGGKAYGIPDDAPVDGLTYGRKDAAWSEVGGGIADAPSDGTPYERQDATWVPAGATGFPDAPSDGTPYERQDATWVPAGQTGFADAPADGTTYGRNNAAWTAVLSATDPIPYTVPVGDIAPPSPAQGELWFNSTDASLYLWFDDGSGGQWVEISASGAGGITQAEADARYLQLSGGTVTGGLTVNNGITAKGGGGSIRLNANDGYIIGVITGGGASDATSKSYVDTNDNTVRAELTALINQFEARIAALEAGA
jgi:hypothetical protein